MSAPRGALDDAAAAAASPAAAPMAAPLAAAAAAAAAKKSTVLLDLVAAARAAGRPLRVVAPMVDQSELPFRLLAKRYGADLAYTPMLHARMTVESPSYLDRAFTTCAAERPVVAQFCANDPAVLLAAARRVQDRVDAVDINMGCPQGIAKRGQYGAFLLPVEPGTAAAKTALLVSLVSTLAAGLTVPVTCKIRLLPTPAATLALVLALQDAGAAVIAIHGRQRGATKDRVGAADWAAIAAIKAHPAVRVPIFANGGVACAQDVDACARATGVDGVMASEALLENPGLFTDRAPVAPLVLPAPAAAEEVGRGSGAQPSPLPPPLSSSLLAPPAPAPGTGAPPAASSCFDMASEYLALAAAWPGADAGCVRAHLIKMLFAPLETWTDLRDALVATKAGPEEFAPVVAEGARRYAALCRPALPWPLPAPPTGWRLADGDGGASDAQAVEESLVGSLQEALAASQAGAARTPPPSPSAPAAAVRQPPLGADDVRSLARLSLLWSHLRAVDPQAGLPHPACGFDVGVPGLWYVRYRRDVFSLPKPVGKREKARVAAAASGAGDGTGAAAAAAAPAPSPTAVAVDDVDAAMVQSDGCAGPQCDPVTGLPTADMPTPVVVAAGGDGASPAAAAASAPDDHDIPLPPAPPAVAGMPLPQLIAAALVAQASLGPGAAGVGSGGGKGAVGGGKGKPAAAAAAVTAASPATADGSGAPDAKRARVGVDDER
jgi:tRNA-dihydrouridine synthase